MKTRFCPSPTGYIHLGNARTALICDLFAKSQKGKFLLRIEDTDAERSDEKFTNQLLKDLQWMNIVWNEGPEVGGDAGPYWQSQRQPIYDSYYQKLIDEKKAYPCFCTEQELAINRKIQVAQNKPPRYAGTCRELSKEQIAEKTAKGLSATLRFRMPDNEIIAFTDLVKGEQKFNTADIGDFIIRRTDGTAPFLYCNAIDDSLMRVTHVLRGEDHLTNTPRQLLILKALGLTQPLYGHISLILGSDGAPLSKRTGSRSIMELAQEGYLSEGVNNYLARLGHNYASTGFLDETQLAEQFKLENLGRSAARFDKDQMLFWQKEAVQHIAKERFWHWLGKEVHEAVPENLKELFIEIVRPNIIFPKDALHWAQILFASDKEFSAENKEILQQTSKEFFKVSLEFVETKGINYEILCQELKEKLQVKGKQLFQPLRIALTYEAHGPELKGIMELLGENKVKERLQKAMNVSK